MIKIKFLYIFVEDEHLRPKNNIRTKNLRSKNNNRDENIHPLQNIGNVWINKEQYFGNVSEVAWNFYIGGYKPAQKWLKDRKGRTLTNQDIEHYQKIIVALTETDRIMKEIDKINFM